jgi:hypothetical protein
MTKGYSYILKQLTEDDKGYLPIVEIWQTTDKHPEVDIVLTLPTSPTEGQFDALRLILSKWAKHCGFGELAEET